MPVLKKVNSRRIQRLWRRLVYTRRLPKKMEERFGEGYDASPQKILKFGRKFLKEFKSEREKNGNIRIGTNVSGHESPVCISLVYRKERIKHIIGRIKIGFTADGVVIEAIQGAKDKRRASEVNKILEQPWPNRIIQAIEKNARKQGMKRIYLKDPTAMYWFNNPLTGHELGSGAHEAAAEHVRQTMKNFMESLPNETDSNAQQMDYSSRNCNKNYTNFL